MTPDELRLACIELFGERGWQIGCARFLKRDVRTVRRWWDEDSPMPYWAEELLRAEQGRGAAHPLRVML